MNTRKQKIKLMNNQILLSRESSESVCVAFGIEAVGFFWVDFNTETMSASLRSSIGPKEIEKKTIFQLGRTLLKAASKEIGTDHVQTSSEFYWKFKKDPLTRFELAR